MEDENMGMEQVREDIDFDEMENVSSINSKEQEVTLDAVQRQWVNNPIVGESTEVLKILQTVKSSDVNKKDKEGHPFSIALSGTDFVYVFKTDKGDYNPSAWEVVKKIFAIARKQVKLGNQEAGKLRGFAVKVEHIADGFKDKKMKGKSYKVYDCTNGAPEEVVI